MKNFVFFNHDSWVNMSKVLILSDCRLQARRKKTIKKITKQRKTQRTTVVLVALFVFFVCICMTQRLRFQSHHTQFYTERERKRESSAKEGKFIIVFIAFSFVSYSFVYGTTTQNTKTHFFINFSMLWFSLTAFLQRFSVSCLLGNSKFIFKTLCKNPPWKSPKFRVFFQNSRFPKIYWTRSVTHLLITILLRKSRRSHASLLLQK